MNERLEHISPERFRQWSNLIGEWKIDIVKDELLKCWFQIRGSTDDIWTVFNGNTTGRVVLLWATEVEARLKKIYTELNIKPKDNFVKIIQPSWSNSDIA